MSFSPYERAAISNWADVTDCNRTTSAVAKAMATHYDAAKIYQSARTKAAAMWGVAKAVKEAPRGDQSTWAELSAFLPRSKRARKECAKDAVVFDSSVCSPNEEPNTLEQADTRVVQQISEPTQNQPWQWLVPVRKNALAHLFMDKDDKTAQTACGQVHKVHNVIFGTDVSDERLEQRRWCRACTGGR